MPPFDVWIGYITNDLGRKFCPSAKHDVSSEEYTSHPRESIRHGGSDWKEFWTIHPFCEKIFVEAFSKPFKSIPIRPYLDRWSLIECEPTPLNLDRIHWLTYWTRVAVRLYGDKAVLGFAEEDILNCIMNAT